MDKTFSNTFRKAFTVAAFVSLAVMALVTGAAIFQLCVTGHRYARLRDYAAEHGITLTGKLAGGSFQAKTAFPFASSDESDTYDSYSGYYDNNYYSDNSYNHCRQGDASGCPQNGKVRRLRPARPASLPEGDGEAGEGCVNARLKVNSPCVTIR